MSPEKRKELEIPTDEQLAKLPQHTQRAFRNLIFELDYLTGEITFESIREARNNPKPRRNHLF